MKAVRRASQDTDPIREATLSALEIILDPLLDLMFDVGLSVQELNHIVRFRAVHVATKRLLRDSGRNSKSRVAIITGIPRSEVTKLSKLANRRRKTKGGQQPARRTLTGWFSDPKFLNTSGEPAVLPIFGKRRSFENLVSKYGAGIPVRAMLDELVQIGAVERLANQRVSTKTRVPISVGLTPNAIEAAGEHCKDLLGTLIQNLRRAERPMFEATSLISDAKPSMLPIIRRDVAEQGINLINAASSILKRSQGRMKKKGSTRNGCRVGVTIYYFEDSARITADLAEAYKRGRRTNLRRQ
jgi:hypothetical protein